MRTAGTDCCPTCGRVFGSVFDYPLVRVLGVEALPTPEAVDWWSGAAREVQREKQRAGVERWYEAGINMTPEVDAARTAPLVQRFLERLAGLVGRELAPAELRPQWEPDGRFRWAYPVEGTRLFLGLTEKECEAGDGEDVRRVDVAVYCRGINLGSAGGPTLQPLGSIAAIRYLGILGTGPRGVL